MNILHMKYAVEVARLGSLNKAAEALLIAQPNISRSIKELEASLGITIFTRSAKGMVLTEEGKEFIGYARQILRQIDEVEYIYRQGQIKKLRFSVCAPRTHYASEAFAELSHLVDSEAADMIYTEANAYITIDNVLDGAASLGVIRYNCNFDEHFKILLDEKSLNYELVGEFPYVLLMGTDSPLAQKASITEEDLLPFCEILYTDTQLTSNPDTSSARKQINSRIFLSDRACAFDLLSKNPRTFMRATPIPKGALQSLGIVQKDLPSPVFCKDMLIFREGYKLTRLDNLFITALCNSRRACML